MSCLPCACLCLGIVTIVALGVIIPISLFCIKPAYHPPNYTLTQCVVVQSSQDEFRCCQYDSCSCSSCEGLSCSELVTQELNHVACCISESCCELMVFDTCTQYNCEEDSNGEEECVPLTYPCNPHCETWSSTQSCAGTCGTCMNSRVIFSSLEFGKTHEIDTSCGLNDDTCQTKQRNYGVNSTWSCYYGMGQLFLEKPKPDPLIPLYWTVVSCVGMGWLIALCWCCVEIVMYLVNQPSSKVLPL